jgi:hypothetical protein
MVLGGLRVVFEVKKREDVKGVWAPRLVTPGIVTPFSLSLSPFLGGCLGRSPFPLFGRALCYNNHDDDDDDRRRRRPTDRRSGCPK